MKYVDGQTMLAGDVVLISGQYRGTVVAAIDDRSYLPKQEAWAYLGRGSVIDTDFAGLVHYPDDADERFELVRRHDQVEK